MQHLGWRFTLSGSLRLQDNDDGGLQDDDDVVDTMVGSDSADSEDYYSMDDEDDDDDEWEGNFVDFMFPRDSYAHHVYEPPVARAPDPTVHSMDPTETHQAGDGDIGEELRNSRMIRVNEFW